MRGRVAQHFLERSASSIIVCEDRGDCVGTKEDDTITPTGRERGVDPETDRVFARPGDDYVKPSSGRDIIFGEAGNDDLYGGPQKDKIFGGGGNDYIVGGDGEDQLNGSGGNDVIVSGEDFVADEVNCGPGDDIAFVSQADHSPLANDCEEIVTFKSFDPGGGGELRVLHRTRLLT